ncbi:MAG: cytosine/adenosine deaminase-related metal-dependent hydrolase [Pirellulaceae bacterium]|jgi:cytosine/adenosine deaminase-related metal-dependent hydrolase
MIIAAKFIVPVVGPVIEGGAIHVENGRITRIESSWQGRADHDFGNAIILPGLINTHTHLEFSDLETPLGEGSMPFPDWIRSVIQWRRSHDESTVAERTIAAVQNGLRESLRAGTTTVGEIATYDVEISVPDSPHVIAFRELIGLAPERVESLLGLAERHLNAASNALAAISPHAPYTVHPDLLTEICQMSHREHFPVAMHLAESREELQLLDEQGGAMQQMLAAVGAWPQGVFRPGTRPLFYLSKLRAAWRSLVVHGNYLDSEELDFIAANRETMSLVYCPRTHHYFGHDRYPLADALERGVRVVLGTDSRASNPDLCLLNEMRFVVQTHEGISNSDVLEMATIRGAESLGLQQDRGSLQVDKRADLVVMVCPSETRDPVDYVLNSKTQPAAVFIDGCEVA